jgi:hypothetical protein
VIALVENVGFGGSHAAPAAKGVYEAYMISKGLVPTDQIDPATAQANVNSNTSPRTNRNANTRTAQAVD